ncbi:hypothetical protein DSM21852_42330 (plasmid) [Methylocystis bryophila]|nr:hypothetical protein DSM21852_42330 [Methylocystis bryophila]
MWLIFTFHDFTGRSHAGRVDDRLGSTCAISALFQRVCSSPNHSRDAGADYERTCPLEAAAAACPISGHRERAPSRLLGVRLETGSRHPQTFASHGGASESCP